MPSGNIKQPMPTWTDMTESNAVSLEQIEQALEDDELLFYYQPRISLISGNLDGAEALLRWKHSDGGITLPGEFLPQAEESGLITKITRRMFQQLVQDIQILRDLNPELSVSFNVSPKDFISADLVEDIRQALIHHAFSPKSLQLEITESSVIETSEEVRRHLTEISDMGIALYMDDFSKGFSSIDTLSRWPFNGLKIDKDLLCKAPHDPKYGTILKNTMMLAHQLGMEMVAEGVEEEELYDMLLRCGCSKAQGYWFSLPLPLEEFISFMQSEPRWTGMPAGLLHLAQLDHLQWRKSLIEAVTSLAFSKHPPSDNPLNRLPPMDHHECRLGKWFYGPGQHLHDLPEFRALEEPHRRFHQLSHELVEAAENNASKSHLLRLMRLLTKESITVIALLQELEDLNLVELETTEGGFSI
jgi:EAL domain-containing protein (putative c-di-GMP-specific phosphodiesterase class I)